MLTRTNIILELNKFAKKVSKTRSPTMSPDEKSNLGKILTILAEHADDNEFLNKVRKSCERAREPREYDYS